MTIDSSPMRVGCAYEPIDIADRTQRSDQAMESPAERRLLHHRSELGKIGADYFPQLLDALEMARPFPVAFRNATS